MYTGVEQLSKWMMEAKFLTVEVEIQINKGEEARMIHMVMD